MELVLSSVVLTLTLLTRRLRCVRLSVLMELKIEFVLLNAQIP